MCYSNVRSWIVNNKKTVNLIKIKSGCKLLTLFSNIIPDIEIQMQNEPVALVFSGEYIKAYKIIQKGNYFIINERRTRGIYTIKGRGWNWGKTKVYFYYVEETNPIDPILTNELNKFIRSNELTKIKLRDVRHGARLRILNKLGHKLKEEGTGPLEKLQEDEAAKLENMDDAIEAGAKKINETEVGIKEQYDKDVSLSPSKKSYMLLEHLLESKQIDDVEYHTLLQKIENHELNFEGLINELREFHVIRVYEPLDVNVEAYINELGAQNARELAGFVQDLRNNKKGLADMTSKPVTSFISAGVILAGGIVILLAVILIPQSLPAMTGGKAGGVNLNPLQGFLGPPQGAHFLLNLVSHAANFVLGLFL